jgi:hypothetical protein
MSALILAIFSPYLFVVDFTQTTAFLVTPTIVFIAASRSSRMRRLSTAYRYRQHPLSGGVTSITTVIFLALCSGLMVGRYR